MIRVIVVRETNKKSVDYNQLVISHGIDEDGKMVIMESERVASARYVVRHPEYGYILRE